MSGKNLINSVDDIVNESLIGCTLLYPNLELHRSNRVVLKPKWNEVSNKVSLICGGGSGHEPFAAGFVGTGMLSASVAGAIYASPTSKNILHAIRCVSMNNKAGCLVIIPNYTGDCLNFGLAIEQARHLNIKISQIIVGDDCSIPDSELGRAGKRALPGILFVIKIAGSLAEKGIDLEETLKYAELTASNIASCSVGLTTCTIPGQERAPQLPDNEIEFGRGLHGEAGYQRIQLDTASNIVSLMIDTIVKSLNLQKDDSVAVLINNFGGLSQLEQGIIVKEVVLQLGKMDIVALRVYSGTLMSSLDSSGVHVSMLKLPEHEKSLLLSCLDEETEAPSWPGCSYSLPAEMTSFDEVNVDESLSGRKRLVGPTLNGDQQELLRDCLLNACQAVVSNEATVNGLDRGCGDGDCGTTLRHLSEEILSILTTLPLSHPSSMLSELADIAEDCMGGTSGAIYSLMFTTAATEMAQIGRTDNWLETWAQAWRAGLTGIMKYSKARIGDKTLIDVLSPAINELENHTFLPYHRVADQVATIATRACEDTKSMIPRAGRASYVRRTEFLRDVDAGAFAAAIWINAVANTLQVYHTNSEYS